MTNSSINQSVISIDKEKQKEYAKIRTDLVRQLKKSQDPKNLSLWLDLTTRIKRIPRKILHIAHTQTAQQHTINHLEKQPVPRQDASTSKMPLKFSKVVIKLQKMIQSARKVSVNRHHSSWKHQYNWYKNSLDFNPTSLLHNELRSEYFRFYWFIWDYLLID